MKRFGNFGHFGKSAVVLPPGAPEQTTVAPTGTTSSPTPTVPVQVDADDDDDDDADVTETTTVAPSTSGGGDEVSARLMQLRQAVEAKRRAREAEIQNVREQHWRQSTYGRDTVQNRPDRAGYATESEKLMGGRTGYYQKPAPAPAPAPAIQGLGAASELNQAAAEVERASEIVKRVTADVKAGIVPRSDLARAIADLNEKSKKAKSLTQLSGLSDGIKYAPWLLGAVGVAAIALYFCKR